VNKQEIYTLIQQYFADKPVNKVSLFGSFARNENSASSDIDLLIQPQKPLGLFTLGRYIADLEDITHTKVDLTTEAGISAEFYHEIQNDLKLLYAK
jgi:predicted nucleotidyltransferase